MNLFTHGLLLGLDMSDRVLVYSDTDDTAGLDCTTDIEKDSLYNDGNLNGLLALLQCMYCLNNICSFYGAYSNFVQLKMIYMYHYSFCFTCLI